MSSRDIISHFRKSLNASVIGIDHEIELVLAGFFAGGHVLFEGPPGVGKTTLARSLAAIAGLEMKRLQMTSDLLPSDLIGILRLRSDRSDFEFRQGPIFTNILVADELNRCNPKTQSALLEAMAEGKVSVDGKTYDLPKPFLVIATQNPHESQGVFPLVESQLDRFMMKIHIAPPAKQNELKIYENFSKNSESSESHIRPLSKSDLVTVMEEVRRVHLDDSFSEFLTLVAEKSRDEGSQGRGMSVRAGLHFILASKSLALVRGRNYVIPQDMRDLFVPVLGHRIENVSRILETVSLPA